MSYPEYNDQAYFTPRSSESEVDNCTDIPAPYAPYITLAFIISFGRKHLCISIWSLSKSLTLSLKITPVKWHLEGMATFSLARISTFTNLSSIF